MAEYISRQAAISAICNACGKIDCNKMDKCEKLQLPPANCSEFPNNSDTISRQAAIDALAKTMPTPATPDGAGEFDHEIHIADEAFADAIRIIESLEPADVVPVVRCKDCIHNNDCDIQHSAQAGENFFCGFGETEKDVREDVYE